MSFPEGCVIGFNDPSSFTVLDDRLFILAANGVIVSHGSEFHFWRPSTTRGLYKMSRIASNSKGILCLAEEKLSVSLQFFHGSDCRFINEVPEVATTSVDMLTFSMDSDTLFVLCSTPSNVVKVLKSVGGRFSQMTVVHCEGTFNSLVIPAMFTNVQNDFIVVHGRGFSGFSSSSGEYVDSISSSKIPEKVLSCVALAHGVLLGNSSGEVYLYDYEEKEPRLAHKLDHEGGITTMSTIDGTTYMGSEAGNIFKYDAEQGFTFMASVGSPIRKISVPQSGGSSCYVGADSGIFQLELTESNGTLFNVKMRTGTVLKCMASSEGDVIISCNDGSFLTMDLNDKKNAVYWRSSEPTKVLDSCLLSNKRVLLGDASGAVTCCSTVSGKLLWSHLFSNFKSSVCESNGADKIIVANNTSLRLLVAGEYSCDLFGMVRITSSSTIIVIHWIPGENRFLVACKNGELHLLQFPESPLENDNVECGIETLLVSIWRLDFPLVDFVTLYSEAEVINILAHSVDKDTKLYALERRRDGDTKLLRPLFLMRDHESGGACLARFNPTTILSGGKDGRLILRDVEHYQVKLSAIPPSKEKRKPIFDSVVRQFTFGGASTACVMGDYLVSGGADAVLTVTPTTEKDRVLRWKEPSWNSRTYTPKKVDLAEEYLGDTQVHEQNKEELIERMNALRQEWNSVMNSMDVDVSVDSLLLPERQAEFNNECEESIEQMKEDNHYHMLLNQFVQHHIRKNCWETMAVIRRKVVSMTDRSVQVHNFHLLKAITDRNSIAHKILFVRQLQDRVGSGYRLKSLRSALSPTSRTKLLTSDDYKTAQFSPFDVYTRTRAVMQSIILQGRILFLKTAFNQAFDELMERKKTANAQIEERNKRCIKIMKQLGEQPTDFFAVVNDPEENPLTVFDVADEELPDDIRALVVKKSEVTIVSPSNEAALKLWMDGLEKDFELLQVDLPLPDFADESKDAYIPPEERTEEQAKIFEDYEKKLKEEIEMVNIKKEGLRNEFKNLQKLNRECAESVDEVLTKLRYKRLISAEEINECEMRLVNLLQQLLRSPGAFRRYENLDVEKFDLVKKLKHIAILLKGKRDSFSEFQAYVTLLTEQNEGMIDDVKSDSPFTDAAGDKLYRRFVRWKKKFDEGKSNLDDVKKPDDVSDAVWEEYHGHCEAAVALRDELQAALDQQTKEQAALDEMEQKYHNIEDRILEKEDLKKKEKSDYFKLILNTSGLYALHQGQIQDETAAFTSEFASSCLRWVEDVEQYNNLIFASDTENAKLLEKIIHRRKIMKFLRWETQRLRYSIGTFEVELRQLHTLRVTRQMQEWLSGDSAMSEDKIVENIDKHIRYVNQKMNKKVQDLTAVSLRMKSQIGERVTENSIVQAQSEELKKSVEDKKSVKKLVDVHADGSLQFAQRAKEIYETSELEELARSQQEELIGLKREVDRMRERTFPSFAVMAKRRV